MTKKLIVKKLTVGHVNAKDIPALFDAQGIAFEAVDCVDWKDAFPYAPQVSFRMAYTADALLLHYKVSEESVRAIAAEDNGRVWEDACCEFFCAPAADATYYNIECNCIGTVLVGYGATRENRTPAPPGIVHGVKRWSSLGDQPFDTQAAPEEWQLALVIPFATFFKHGIDTFDGRTIRANFYKCGDKLPQPHFLSWSPIELPSPDFHCPKFFGEVFFD